MNTMQRFASLLMMVTGLNWCVLGQVLLLVILDSYGELGSRAFFFIFWNSLCMIGKKNLPANSSGPGDLGNVFNYKFELFTKNSIILVFYFFQNLLLASCVIQVILSKLKNMCRVKVGTISKITEFIYYCICPSGMLMAGDVRENKTIKIHVINKLLYTYL